MASFMALVAKNMERLLQSVGDSFSPIDTTSIVIISVTTDHQTATFTIAARNRQGIFDRGP